MKSLIRILAAGFFLLLCSQLAFPQAQATSADLRGTITDQNGAVVAGATITLSSTERGIARTAKTDERGQYQLLAVPPGSYEMTSQAPGFAPQINKGVVLTIGETQVLDVQMSVKGATEQVVVTTQPPLVEIDKTQQSNTIDERRINDLPINRRNFLDFTLLVPGVTDSSAIADNSDFRVVQTPQSGLSFYGSNGRGNSITIDGVEDNSGSGGVRSTVSQDAVQEFQVNRSNYSAEFGGASGGIVNI
ncbi:MAG: carboxypeptidase regulatory-like domain-containing protein, partial [Blastocatellia bacterium]